MDPDEWRDLNENGLQLLSHLDLKHYRNKFPGEENLQDEWEAAVTNPGKYVKLLVGQLDMMRISGQRQTRRTITIVCYGIRKQRASLCLPSGQGTSVLVCVEAQ